MRQDLRIRASFEYVAAGLELTTEFAVIVDLAIEDSSDRPDSSVFVCHRLRSGWRQVNDAEARINESCLRP